MTVILMALKNESNGLIEQIVQAQQGLTLHYTGFGLLAAAQKTTEIICQLKPERILNLGTAGSRSFPVGHIVECTQFSNRTPDILSTLKYSLKVPALTDLPQAHCGSADHIDLSEAALAHEVLDMEAFSMAYVCQKMNIPFHSIKYITDSSEGDVPSVWKTQLQAASEGLQKTLQRLIQTKVIS